MRFESGARNLPVGRIGGLAIALGVGAAMASGAGVAWADTTDTAGAAGADRGGSARQSEPGRTAKPTAARTARTAAKPAQLASVAVPSPDSSPDPVAPLTSTTSWAVAAAARRDPGRGVRLAGASVPTASFSTAAVTATPSTLTSGQLGWVTGQRNTAFPGNT